MTFSGLEIQIPYPSIAPEARYQSTVERIAHQLVNNRSLAALSLAGKQPTNVTLIEPIRALFRRLTERPIFPFAPIPGTRVVVTEGPGDAVLGTVSLP